MTLWPHEPVCWLTECQIYNNHQETLVIIWRTIYASTLPWKKHKSYFWDLFIFSLRLLYLNQFYLEINIFCWDRTSQNHLLTLLFKREVQGDILVNVMYVSIFISLHLWFLTVAELFALTLCTTLLYNILHPCMHLVLNCDLSRKEQDSSLACTLFI